MLKKREGKGGPRGSAFSVKREFKSTVLPREKKKGDNHSHSENTKGKRVRKHDAIRSSEGKKKEKCYWSRVEWRVGKRVHPIYFGFQEKTDLSSRRGKKDSLGGEEEKKRSTLEM